MHLFGWICVAPCGCDSVHTFDDSNSPQWRMRPFALVMDIGQKVTAYYWCLDWNISKCLTITISVNMIPTTAHYKTLKLNMWCGYMTTNMRWNDLLFHPNFMNGQNVLYIYLCKPFHKFGVNLSKSMLCAYFNSIFANSILCVDYVQVNIKLTLHHFQTANHLKLGIIKEINFPHT